MSSKLRRNKNSNRYAKKRGFSNANKRKQSSFSNYQNSQNSKCDPPNKRRKLVPNIPQSQLNSNSAIQCISHHSLSSNSSSVVSDHAFFDVEASATKDTVVMSVSAQCHNNSANENTNSMPRHTGSSHVYRDLEVVWARLEDFPWWPATCVLPSCTDSNDIDSITVRWFGIDHDTIDKLSRDRIIPFSMSIKQRLLDEVKVESPDQDDYNQSVEQANLKHQEFDRDKFGVVYEPCQSVLSSIIS